jgi:hypothetical protein
VLAFSILEIEEIIIPEINNNKNSQNLFYRVFFYSFDELTLLGCCEAHVNFADESACLTGANVWNDVVTIHRPQEVLKMLSTLHANIFCNYLFH